MRGAVLRAYDGPVSIEEIEIDRPGRRAVLMRTAAAGLCHGGGSAIHGRIRMTLQAVIGHWSYCRSGRPVLCSMAGATRPEGASPGRLQGCIVGSNRFRVDLPRWVELCRRGRLRLDEMVTARISLDGRDDAIVTPGRGDFDGAGSVVVFA